MNENDNNSTLPMDPSERNTERVGEAPLSTELIGSDASSQPSTAKQINPSEQTTVKQDQPFLIDGRFIIERELGRGGIGVAYLAVDTKEDNRRVVLKALLERFDDKDSVWVERHFREEVKALARINHPGVVKLIASGNMPYGKPFLAMEFVEGYELRALVEPEKGLRDFARIARIIRQLGEAMSAAHDSGIYHRDLKPENIMLTDASGVEQVKVIDFGIATVKESLDEKTKTTVLAGSIRYMAPEQLFGKPTATTDIYAMGVIAYEMITGRVPFNADLSHPLAAMQQLLEMQRKGVRVLPKDLRPSLSEQAQVIILRALAYQPSVRYQRADEFGAELFQALTGQDEEALVESFFNRTGEQDVQPTGQPVSESATQVKEIQATGIEKPQTTTRSASKTMGAFAALLLVVALAFFAWNYLKSVAEESEKSNAPVTVPQRVLSYYAERITKASGGQKISRLTADLTRETFTKNDSLRFFITSANAGFFYLINEEDETGNYNILFPSPRDTNKSSTMTANSVITTDELSFLGNAGTEKIWLVWSETKIPELEEAIGKFTNNKDEGDIKSDELKTSTRKLLESNSEIKLEQAPTNERMLVRGKGDLIVYGLILKHR